jgi:hypothetical protein
MSDESAVGTIDLIRWTFAADPGRKGDIAAHLVDLGAEVHAGNDGHFTVLWDEPHDDLDEIVEELWLLNGTAFEVTHEAFHRVELSSYHQADESEQAA